MNMKKTWKRFFSLNRHHAEGFTLVELIVVIAILAILGGVAVPAYSGYVEKANKQADISLISEIEHALTLAMYSTPFTENPSGILVVSKDGITLNGSAIAEGSEMDIALRNAFGGTLDGLKLTYDGWTASGHLNGMNAFGAQNVVNSSYLSGGRSDMLLSDVEKFTLMAANLSEALTGTPLTSGTTLASLYGQDLLNATADKYGIKVGNEYKDSNGNVDWDKWGAANSQEYSNMLVLATAMDTQNAMNGGTTSAATDLVTGFSSYYAFAATCPEFSGVLTQYLDAMTASGPTTINGVTVDPVTGASQGGQWLNKLQAEANKYTNSDGLTYTDYTTPYNDAGDTYDFEDKMAFQSIMASLSNATKDDIAGDLGNSNLFTQGAIKDMYDQYLDTSEALANMVDPANPEFGLNLAQGEVAIIYNQNSCTVVNTIND